VRARFPEPDLAWALQNPPQGTGHALAQALPQLAPDGVTLVLFGADPLVRASTLETVVRHARRGALSLLTIELDDPNGYGRIVRGADGAVKAVVEHKDATPEELVIREINTGVMAAPTACFARWLATIDNSNASGEYYLTDVIPLAVKEGVPVEATRAANLIETLGVNTMRELAQLERLYQRAQADALTEAGVFLTDPDRIDIRGTLQCGKDVSIDVGCMFEGDVRLADGVAIGAHCMLNDSNVGAAAQVLPYSHLVGATVGAKARIGPTPPPQSSTRAYDVFICHAHEDKAAFVRPLAEALERAGLRVWYDEFEMTVGDSLHERIDHGLASSRHGVVVVSPAFFKKRHWPQKELAGLAATAMPGDRRILPVRHGMSLDDLRAISPTLADIASLDSSVGVDDVSAQIERVCKNPR
jgi:NDP-sugar pyrophosphorylase family protein